MGVNLASLLMRPRATLQRAQSIRDVHERSVRLPLPVAVRIGTTKRKRRRVRAPDARLGAATLADAVSAAVVGGNGIAILTTSDARHRLQVLSRPFSGHVAG